MPNEQELLGYANATMALHPRDTASTMELLADFAACREKGAVRAVPTRAKSLGPVEAIYFEVEGDQPELDREDELKDA
jgi:hypothetical protein